MKLEKYNAIAFDKNDRVRVIFTSSRDDEFVPGKSSSVVIDEGFYNFPKSELLHKLMAHTKKYPNLKDSDTVRTMRRGLREGEAPNILSLLLVEEEDRKRRADLPYTEKTKGKGAEKVVDRVITTLSGSESGVWTRNLRAWDKVKAALARLDDKRKKLEDKFKNDAIQLFAAEDEVLTRVVEAAEFSVLLKKQVPPEDKSSVDYELLVKELTDVMPELVDKIKELETKYTTVVKGVKPEKPTMMISKDKLSEGIITDVVRAFKQAALDFLRSMKSWGKSFDKKLNSLKKKAAKL